MPRTGNMAMTRQQVSEFEKANAQLGGLFEEISALSRKSGFDHHFGHQTEKCETEK